MRATLVAVLLCLVSGSTAFAQTSTPPAGGDLTGAVTDRLDRAWRTKH